MAWVEEGPLKIRLESLRGAPGCGWWTLEPRFLLEDLGNPGTRRPSQKKKRRLSQVEWGKSLREAAMMRTKCAHPLRQGLTPLCLEGKAGMK